MRKKAERSHFNLTFNAKLAAANVSYLRRYLHKAHAILRSPLEEISIALVNDKQMSALHKKFLNIAGPTDVLTFPIDFSAKGKPVSGEIVICFPHARRAAKKHGVTLKNELLLYALHGMLHLAGFDDRTAAQYNRMHRIEDEILARLGVGPVFDRFSRPATGRARGER